MIVILITILLLIVFYVSFNFDFSDNKKEPIKIKLIKKKVGKHVYVFYKRVK